jgi:hypothetical protein
MIDLSRAYLGYGTAAGNANVICDNVGNSSINGSGTFSVKTTGGLAVGKNIATSGYALDVSGNVIINNGNVGIGTPASGYKLDVAGELRVGTASYYGINLGNSGVGSYRSAYIYGDGTNMEINNQQNGRLVLSTNNSEKVRITPEGNVGIGTTAPQVKLHVYDASNPKIFLGNGANRSFFSLFSGNTDIGCDSGSTNIRFMPDGNEKMRITADGNVGIGTTSPEAKLHVKKDIGSDNITDSQHNLQFEISRATGTKSMSFGVMDSGVGVIQVKERGYGYNHLLLNPIQHYTNSFVGIGTSAPATSLDVNGTISTNKMLLRTPDYTTSLGPSSYNEGNWYTAIDNNILQSEGIYIITLKYIVSSGGKPWNLYTSFMHYCGITNSLDINNNSGAAVPTTLHDGDGYDFQIYVRGKTGSVANSGVEFKLNTSTVQGSWNVKAYRII